MRHRYFGKKLSRTKNERRRLLMSLARELIAHSQIKTTLTRARAVQPLVEKLITHAKSGTSTAKQKLRAVLADTKSVRRLQDWASTRFGGRTSGFTRIVRLGLRSGDSTEEVLFSFVDPTPVEEEPKARVKKEKSVKKEKKEVISPKKQKGGRPKKQATKKKR